MDEQNKNEQPEANQTQQTTNPLVQPTIPTPTPQKGYSKRPWWQWLLIYVAIGAVVYGIIYAIIVYSADNGGTDNSNVYGYLTAKR